MSEHPPKEYFLPLPWAELAVHEQHLQIQMSQDSSMQQEDEVCASGELMVCSKRHEDELNIKPQAQAPKEEPKNDPWPQFHWTINQPTNVGDWWHWMRNRDGKEDFLAIGKAE